MHLQNLMWLHISMFEPPMYSWNLGASKWTWSQNSQQAVKHCYHDDEMVCSGGQLRAPGIPRSRRRGAAARGQPRSGPREHGLARQAARCLAGHEPTSKEPPRGATCRLGAVVAGHTTGARAVARRAGSFVDPPVRSRPRVTVLPSSHSSSTTSRAGPSASRT